MTAKFLYELASLFQTEADGITKPYAWPPREPLTPEERREVERLRVTAASIAQRGNLAAYEEQQS